MNKDDLMTCVSHLMEAYNDMSAKVRRLEKELDLLRKKYDSGTGKGCKIYRMGIREKLPTKV